MKVIEQTKISSCLDCSCRGWATIGEQGRPLSGQYYCMLMADLRLEPSVVNLINRALKFTVPLDSIPDWCPLPDDGDTIDEADDNH